MAPGWGSEWRRESYAPAEACSRLTVGLMGRGWSRPEVLLWELSHLLGETGVATQLGSCAGSNETLGPKAEFILKWVVFS